MPVTASEVKALRELTGAGMMECKKALTETDGDLDDAIALLRKKGAASAEKKSGRIAAEGVIAFAICLLYTSPSPRDRSRSRMPSSA